MERMVRDASYETGPKELVVFHHRRRAYIAAIGFACAIVSATSGCASSVASGISGLGQVTPSAGPAAPLTPSAGPSAPVVPSHTAARGTGTGSGGGSGDGSGGSSGKHKPTQNPSAPSDPPTLLPDRDYSVTANTVCAWSVNGDGQSVFTVNFNTHYEGPNTIGYAPFQLTDGSGKVLDSDLVPIEQKSLSYVVTYPQAMTTDFTTDITFTIMPPGIDMNPGDNAATLHLSVPQGTSTPQASNYMVSCT